MKRLDSSRKSVVLVLASLLVTSAAWAEPTSEAEIEKKGDVAHPHQLAVGAGLPLMMHVESEGVFSSTDETVYIGDEFLWVSVPLRYRYRVNSWFAVGGGLVFNKMVNDDRSSFGVEARPGVRFYPLPEWLYIDFDLMVGYPDLWALVPGIGVQIPVTDQINVFVHNEVPMRFFSDGFALLWRPVLGVEFKI